MVRIIRVGWGVAFTFGDGSIQAEELGDCYADGGESERRTEPG